MEDDSEVAMPETTSATTTTSAVNSKSGNKSGENEESKQKKKVMTIGSTSIIPLKGADVSSVCHQLAVQGDSGGLAVGLGWLGLQVDHSAW